MDGNKDVAGKIKLRMRGNMRSAYDTSGWHEFCYVIYLSGEVNAQSKYR